MRALHLVAVIAGLGLAGCEAVNFLPGEEPIHLVVRGGAPFWTYGPQQAGGPDEKLDLGDQVAVVRWEYGFSRVQLESGATGYAANEDLELAPPGTARRVGLIDEPVVRPRGRPVVRDVAQPEVPRTNQRRNRPRPYEGPIVDDAPLPELEPDLDVAPADAPLG